MSQLLISAAHKSSGKTTICIGLCAALRARGLSIAPFKKGPDYIDPLWLGLAAGRACHSLDFHTSSEEGLLRSYQIHGADADLCLIEGNKGLHDGMDLTGGNSNAALAKLLGAPVVMVIDTRGTIRGIAPLLIGYRDFDPQVNIAGVILNQVGGARHEAKLRAVIEHYTDIPVLGAVARSSELELVERHLGLMPSNEDAQASARVQSITRTIAGHIDLDRLLAIAARHPLPARDPAPTPSPAGPADVSIAIARDAAFGFYYPGDLDAFTAAGARLVPFDTLRDAALPAVDGLFIGGGFPETHMEALEANRSLRQSIHAAIESGLPAYAECGGLMYLSRSLTWGDQRRQMVGVIPADVRMHERPQGRGYVRLRETGQSLWPASPETSESIPAHEFHYSSLEGVDPEWRYAYTMLRGQGIDGVHDGIVHRNLLASYTHLRNTDRCAWVPRFVAFVRAVKQGLRVPPQTASPAARGN